MQLRCAWERGHCRSNEIHTILQITKCRTGKTLFGLAAPTMYSRLRRKTSENMKFKIIQILVDDLTMKIISRMWKYLCFFITIRFILYAPTTLSYKTGNMNLEYTIKTKYSITGNIIYCQRCIPSLPSDRNFSQPVRPLITVNPYISGDIE